MYFNESPEQPLTIYHNPNCSKSRETLKLLLDRNLDPYIIHYMEEPPSEKTVRELIEQLEFTSARQLLRTNEARYKSLEMDGIGVTESFMIEVMSNYPELMERPIVAFKGKARLGRPPEKVLELFKELS